MSSVNGAGEAGIISSVGYALNCMVDNPITRKTKECVLAPFIYVKNTAENCVVSLAAPVVLSPFLSIMKALGPNLDGKQELFFNSIAVYDQLELASEALRLYQSHKRAKPQASFDELK